MVAAAGCAGESWLQAGKAKLGSSEFRLLMSLPNQVINHTGQQRLDYVVSTDDPELDG